MSTATDGITLTFRPKQDQPQTYVVDLKGSRGEDYSGAFTLPYTPGIWAAVTDALEPGFAPTQMDDETMQALSPLGQFSKLRETVGKALAEALLANSGLRTGFGVALTQAEAARRPLPVELRFGDDCNELAALPWELLHHNGRFLVSDSSIALSRYLAMPAPPTPALAELPLRVLLVLSEPLDASPILPERAREQLVHGLRQMDEEGAVIVDLLKPPTFDTLIEAVENGGYHMLVFYGHGVYDAEQGGQLLFEDEFGGKALVAAANVGAALRNTDVRLVLLGACQSSQVGEGKNVWSATAPALIRAGVPLVIGMQVSMLVVAAQAFIRQFSLSLAAGRPVAEAVASARKPLLQETYGKQWFVPTLYGRVADVDRLFDETTALPEETADLRAAMKELRTEIAEIEQSIGSVGVAYRQEELARLRTRRAAFAQKRTELARRTPGGYAQVISPMYGVPSNPVFVGRSQVLRRVAQGLHADHPVVIWGTGGIGKTALAVEVAHRQNWRFPAGVLWLDCRGGPPFDTLLNRIGAFCGVEGIEQVEPDRKETLVRHALTSLDARCLLVWDNAEAVWENREVRQFVVQRLPGNCQVLLTTRQNPEQPMWHTEELVPLADQVMTTLFYRLAIPAGVKAGTQTDLDAIPEMVAWLQGHPLAMILVVPLMVKRGIRRVWSDLQKRPLKGIEAAFALSYERLTALQGQLFARLSVFTIPFEWEAAEALLPGETDVEDALDVLVQRALLAFDGSRYAYHALVRQYAYERLQEMEDPRPVHRLAAEHLRAKITDPDRGGTPEETLEDADQWEKAEEWEEFARRASALVGSLDRVGYWAEIGARLDRALAAVRSHLGAESELGAILLGGLGTIAFKSAEWDRAIALYEKALRTMEQVDKVHGMAKIYSNLGIVYLEKGEWDRAIAFYENALQIMEQLGDIHGVAAAYGNLGNVYRQKGEWDRAIEFHEKSLGISEQLSDIHGMAQTYGNLGIVYLQKGEWDRAITFHEKSLGISEQLSDIHGMALTYGNLGNVYQQKGEWDRAIELYEKSLSIKEQMGDIHGMAQTYGNLGIVYRQKGEWGRAIEFYEKSLRISEQLGDIHGMAQICTNLGNIYRQKGKWDRAIEFHEHALQRMEQLGDIHGMAQTYDNLGMVYLQKGEWDRAIALFEDALQRMEQVGDKRGMARIYSNLGSVYERKDEWDRAIPFYERSLSIKGQVGDIYGMARIYGNLGSYYQARRDKEQAAQYTARAYRIFAHLGAPETQQAGRQLISILGTVEAAEAYLAQVAEEMQRKT
jgi:tetratricopeptide (TPR) repeat protein